MVAAEVGCGDGDRRVKGDAVDGLDVHPLTTTATAIKAPAHRDRGMPEPFRMTTAKPEGPHHSLTATPRREPMSLTPLLYRGTRAAWRVEERSCYVGRREGSAPASLRGVQWKADSG